MSLAGPWRFALGPDISNIANRLPKLALADTIQLPGTTDENHKGKDNPAREAGRLTRVYPYEGPAWYQREIAVPDDWRGKRITLFLERTKYTAVWVDDRPLGDQDSLDCPHVYDLSALLAPGTHRLTVLVDNSKKPPVGDPHQLSENTQTNWNGIIGRVELRVTPPVWIDDIQVYPDIAERNARVRVAIGNTTGKTAAGELSVYVQHSSLGYGLPFEAAHLQVKLADRTTIIQAECRMRARATPRSYWYDVDPMRCFLTATIDVTNDGNRFEYMAKTDFGIREFKTKGTQFTINGRTTFLRGKHDACVFPLTGHPPMEAGPWVDYFRTCKSYGINHVRFHTWCPPEAAFAAADSVGVYLQPELPNGVAFDGKSPHDRYLWREAERIVQTFGNHPCFVMLSLGNELGGDTAAMAKLVKHLRDIDPRHLYAQGSNNFWWKPSFAPGDDYWTTVRTPVDHGMAEPVRGSFATIDAPLGHVQTGPASTMTDYRRAIAGVRVPVIGHEVGQYTVFPDFREIAKYTGVLRARNLEIFRENLRAKGMLDQAEQFRRASGALAVLCYREDIEAALRTPGFGGFQLLDLQDFPGQGTALVGILDAFMDSKGLIEPKAWREFCSEVVPLVRMNKYAWTTGETFTAALEVAHYGEADLRGVKPAWSLSDSQGKIVASGQLPAIDVRQGGVTAVGNITTALADVPAPQKLTLKLSLPRTQYVNHYGLWVYPAKIDTTLPPGVTLARALDRKTRQTLAAGGRVLLMPEAGSPVPALEGGFATDFWCWPMFHNRPGTMGILCDPKHPALARFPTEFHGNWQWFPIVTAARPIILDATPASYRPIVQVIDNLQRNHKLGLVLETKAGPGKLLICACDLLKLSGDPQARQLLSSLLSYAASDRFQPSSELQLPLP